MHDTSGDGPEIVDHVIVDRAESLWLATDVIEHHFGERLAVLLERCAFAWSQATNAVRTAVERRVHTTLVTIQEP